MPGVLLSAFQLEGSVYAGMHVFWVLCKQWWTNVIERCCQLIIAWPMKNWLVFDLSPCQVDRSSIEYNSRGLRLRSSAIQLRAESVQFFYEWRVMGTELLAELYHLQCSWGPATGSCGRGWEIKALCFLLSIEKNNFVCWAVSLTVSEPSPKTILKAVSKFLLGKAGRLPVRCCKPPK